LFSSAHVPRRYFLTSITIAGGSASEIIPDSEVVGRQRDIRISRSTIAPSIILGIAIGVGIGVGIGIEVDGHFDTDTDPDTDPDPEKQGPDFAKVEIERSGSLSIRERAASLGVRDNQGAFAQGMPKGGTIQAKGL
jgi:hypothetical protein